MCLCVYVCHYQHYIFLFLYKTSVDIGQIFAAVAVYSHMFNFNSIFGNKILIWCAYCTIKPYNVRYIISFHSFFIFY